MEKIFALAFLTFTLVFAQDEDTKKAVNEFFGTQDKPKDPFQNLVEVVSEAPGSLGAFEKRGEGSDQGVDMCVPYHQCDGITRMIVIEGSSNGFGIIDIR